MCSLVLGCWIAVSCGLYAILWIGGSAFVHRHVGSKRSSGLIASLICTGMWVLSDSVAWEFDFFVHRHVGLKRFHGLGALLLCTCVWVLSDLIAWEVYLCAEACGL